MTKIITSTTQIKGLVDSLNSSNAKFTTDQLNAYIDDWFY